MGEWFDAVASLATLGALAAAIWQLWVANKERRETEQSTRADRAMKLYEEVVAGGATAIAFHALSLYLRRIGSSNPGGSVTWRVATDADLGEHGIFSPSERSTEDAFANLYTVLWFFERVDASLLSNVVDPAATYRSVGFHIWWWNQLLLGLEAPKSRGSLTRLAAWVTELARDEGVLDEWMRRCATDFDQGPPTLGTVGRGPDMGREPDDAR